MLADAAGNDAAVMREVGIHIEGDAVVSDPLAHAYANGGDLALAPAAVVDPDADLPSAPLALQIEAREGADHPLLEAGDEAAHVAGAVLQVEQHIGHALAGPVIGVLPAAARSMNRERSGLEQVRVARAGAGGVERRMLQEPDELRRGAGADRRDPPLHPGNRRLVIHGLVAD